MIVENLFDGILNQCAKEFLDVYIPPISKSASAVSFRDVRPKA